MAKRNKIRYQTKEKTRIALSISGAVFLRYRDEEHIEQARKGDLLVYPQSEALHTTRQGDYDSTGFSGYFKVDVHDGYRWQPVLLNNIFSGREHHFARHECPIDTYELCAELLRALAGKTLLRTYREHYELEEK